MIIDKRYIEKSNLSIFDYTVQPFIKASASNLLLLILDLENTKDHVQIYEVLLQIDILREDDTKPAVDQPNIPRNRKLSKQ